NQPSPTHQATPPGVRMTLPPGRRTTPGAAVSLCPPSMTRVTTDRPAKAGRLYAVCRRLSERGREWVPRKPQAPWLGRDATRIDYASLRDLAGEVAAKEVSLPTTAPPAFTT